MTNWCSNTLHVYGPKESLKRFVEKAEGPMQNYNNFRETKKDNWGPFESVRIKVLASTVPPPGAKSQLSFHALYPVPEGIRRYSYYDCRSAEIRSITGETEFDFGGYTWEKTNWGVINGAYKVVRTTADNGSLYAGLDESGDTHNLTYTATYGFETPWSPPELFLDKVALDFPDLRFDLEYSEYGHGFAGNCGWENGKKTYSNTWGIGEYEEDDDFEED